MEEIDWEAMEDDMELEAVEAMAKESELWLLQAEVRKLQELLEDSEWERERLERRLQDTLSHSCLKVHAGVPIVLIIFFGSSGAKDQLPGH